MDEGRLSISQVFGFEKADQRRKSERLEETVVDLYAAMRPGLVGYAYQVLGSATDAEDLVQIAFLKLFDQLSRKTEIHNLRSWLYRVVHNQAIDQVRRRGKHDSAVEEWLARQERMPATGSTEDKLIQRQRIAISLQSLNERERHCLRLRAEGLSYKEIGEVLAISAKAVSVYLARGLKKFEVQNEKGN
jgi:RNA polymerase sigma-70 factor, ECF subfamily